MKLKRKEAPADNTVQNSEHVSIVGKAVWNAVRHNWPYKILSVILAVVLWAGLITQDPTLTREKVFTDVTISVSGTDTIKRNGYIVTSDLNELLKNATVYANVPQSKYNDAAVSSYNVRVDLTKINEAGTCELRVQSSSSSTYGVVTEIVPSSVTVTVEEYTTRYRIPDSLVTDGEIPDGFYIDSYSLDPPLVAVSGPKSLVDSVVRARAVIDLSSLPAE